MQHSGAIGGFAARRPTGTLPRPKRLLRTQAASGPAPALIAQGARLPSDPASPRPRGGISSALLLSAGLHASAALALVVTQIALASGSAGRGGTDSLTLPSPPAMEVTLLTPADLLPDRAPVAPPTEAPALDAAPQSEPAPPVPAAPAQALAPLQPPSLALPAAEPPPAAVEPPPRVLALAPVPALDGDLPPPPKAPAKSSAAKAKKPAPAADRPKKAKAPAPAAPPAQPVPSAKAAGTGQGALAGQSGAAAEAGVSDARAADLKASWGAKVRARVEARKSYPRAAAGAAGTVKVRLTVARSGKLLSVAIAASSGNAALDQAAVKAVKSAGTFAAAPRGLTQDSYSFTLPMRFAP